MTNQQPKLRFKGFSGDWDEKKLGDVFLFSISNNSLSRANLNNKNGDIKNIHYGDVLINYKSILDVKLNSIPYINNSSIENYKDNFLKNGDIVFADAAEDETVGKAVEIDNVNNEYVVAGLHTIASRPKKELGKYYWGFYINSNSYHRQLLRLIQGSKVSSINKGNLKNSIVKFPKNEEQQKIGTFFKQLDDTIELYQKQLNLVKEQKKGFLQKMFPKDGEKIPELRFKGFSGDWDKIKIGELAEIVRGSSPRPISDPRWFDNNSDIGWLRISDVTKQNGRITNLEQKISKEAENKTRVLYDKHLLLSIAATVGKPVINYVKTGVHDGFLIFINPLFEIEYMYQWLDAYRPKWKKYGQPGSQVNLNSELVKSHSIYIPNNEEQQKIGAFFKQLDENIELLENKLNDLNKLKKGFLQKMFV